MAKSEKLPRIGVSACLLGQAVRYDGGDKFIPAITGLTNEFELVPICPEVEAGLGVPRPPVQLVKKEDQLAALGVQNSELDVTDQLLAFCIESEQLVKTLSGLILKARSPSCGINSTPVLNDGSGEIKTGSGLFADHLIQNFPEIPLIDEEGFQVGEKRVLFLQRVIKHHEKRQEIYD